MHKALIDMNISQYFNRPQHTLSYFLKRNKAQKSIFKFLKERHAKIKGVQSVLEHARHPNCKWVSRVVSHNRCQISIFKHSMTQLSLFFRNRTRANVLSCSKTVRGTKTTFQPIFTRADSAVWIIEFRARFLEEKAPECIEIKIIRGTSATKAKWSEAPSRSDNRESEVLRFANREKKKSNCQEI